jgi:hypothetical protein
MKEKEFPVLYHKPIRETDIEFRLDVPRYVPWEIFIGHERQVDRNHDQTLERLAERGGLHPTEMACILEDKDFDRKLTLEESLKIVNSHMIKKKEEDRI